MTGSIVIPCANEEGNIQPLYDALKPLLDKALVCELIFVDDGSTDGTLSVIKSLRRSDKRVKYIGLMSNYGHQKALMAGLNHCNKDFAITMDADLQHPPEFVPTLIETFKNNDVEVVTGRRQTAQPGLIKSLFSRMFNLLFSWATNFENLDGISDFRLYSKRAIRCLCGVREQEPFIRGMIAAVNLPNTIIEYELGERHSGEPSYTFTKSMRMALEALVRFSDFPVRLGMLVAGIGIILSAGEAIRFVYLKAFVPDVVRGQSELMAFLGVVLSLVLFLLSLLCKMVSQVLAHLRMHPMYVVDDLAVDDHDPSANEGVGDSDE